MNFFDLLVVQQSIPTPLKKINYTKTNIAIAPPLHNQINPKALLQQQKPQPLIY